MNAFCGRLLLVLLMGACGASATPSIALPGLDVSEMPPLPPDTRCSLSVSNPVVDYGTMSRWQLEEIAGGSVSPGTRSLALSVVCPYTRAMKLQVQGENSEQGGVRYGERGYARLRLLDAQLDGNAVELQTLTPTGDITERGGRTLVLNAGEQLAPVVQGRFAEGKIMTVRLEVQPVLAEGDARVSSRQHSEAMLTLTLIN